MRINRGLMINLFVTRVSKSIKKAVITNTKEIRNPKFSLKEYTPRRLIKKL